MSISGSLTIAVGEVSSATITASPTAKVFGESAVASSVTALNCCQENGFSDVFLPSFLAILFAGLIIAFVNYRFLRSMQRQNQVFLKEQKQRGVADLYFSSLEEQIIDYFKEGSQEKADVLGAKTYVYIDTFMVLVRSRVYDSIYSEIKAEFSALLDLDNYEDLDKEARLRRSLKAVATIRYLIAK